MASLVQFSVDDPSPTLQYSPFSDTGSLPDLAAGWNPYFLGSGFASSAGQTGVGQSQHITSRNGASLTLAWHGTSIQLFGNTTASASFNLTLDGAPIQPNQTDISHDLLTSFDGLPNTQHSITLTAITPNVQDPPASSLVVFDKAVITSPPPDDFSQIIFTQHTVDDDSIDFAGQWTFLPSTGLPPFHQSQAQSDTATLTFSGISVLVFGTSSPASGNYSVLLDGAQSPIFSATSSFLNTNTLLFFASGLAPNISHQITLRNEGGTLQLKSGGFTIFSSGEPTALPPPGNTASAPNPSLTPSPIPQSGLGSRFTRGTIAALVLAGFLAAFILSAVLFYFCIWKPRRRRHRQHQRDVDFTFVPPPPRHRKPNSRAYRESAYPQEKDQGPDSAVLEGPATVPGVVLDIGREVAGGGDPLDDTINLTPDRASAIGAGGGGADVNTSSISGDNGGRRGGGHRDSGQSGFNGFSRWKRDINTLSGLTALGISFRHSDEKSPASDYGPTGDDNHNGGESGFIYGTYDPEVDGGIASGRSGGGAERMRSVSTQSSTRSFGRFGRKRSGTHLSGSGNGNGKGKGRLSSRIGSGAFPFRLSGALRRAESSAQGRRHHHDRPHDDESLSGFTSLSYASNPNMAAILDVQPPSYAASVSRLSGSNTSSPPPSVPRSVTRSPQSQSRNLSVPPSPQDTHSPTSPLSEVPPVPVPEHRDSEAHATGHRQSTTSGMPSVSVPISMRAAIRGLSPRISKTRSMEGRRSKTKGKEKETETEQKPSSEEEPTDRRPRELPPPPVPPPRGEISSEHSRSDLTNIRHEQQEGGSDVEAASSPLFAPIPVAITSDVANPTGTRNSSPLRALPPIPIPSPASSTPEPRPQPQPPSQQPGELQRQLSQEEDPTSPAPSASFLNISTSSPFKLSFEPSSTPGSPPSSSSSSSNNERRFKPRSSSGDAAGLGPPGAIQSFAEAAALATTSNVGGGSSMGGILVEGGSTGSGNGGVRGEDVPKRLSRVRFEDDPTSTTSVSPPVSGDGEQRESGSSGFRLTPLGDQSPPVFPPRMELSPGTTDSTLPTPEPGQGTSRPSGHVGTASFLDFSSQPSSLHSRGVSESTGLERSTSVRTTDTGYDYGGHGGRIWSMHLPGRNILPLSDEALKSKWSHTTIQTGRSESSSSSSNSAYGSPPARPPPVLTSEAEGSPRRHLFPFPLAIPPSPHMPEGFTGVEPSPSLLSPTTSLPVPAPTRRYEYGHRLHVPGSAGGGGGVGSGTSRHAATTTTTTTTTTTMTTTTHDPHHITHDPHDPHETSRSGNNHNDDIADSPTDSFPYSISEVHFRTSVGTELSAYDDPDVGGEPGRVQYVHQHPSAHPPLPLAPQRYHPQQEEQQQQQGSSSIVQRVFGGGGGGSGGGNSGNNSGSATPRTPRTGFLKPSSTL